MKDLLQLLWGEHVPNQNKLIVETLQFYASGRLDRGRRAKEALKEIQDEDVS